MLSRNDPMLNFARSHYENFPVVSFLIPKSLQKDVAAIYWFARTADDIADEGTINPVDRLDKLEDFDQRFSCTLERTFRTPYDESLYQTIQSRKLDPELFRNLLKAFKQDVVKKRYQSYQELLDYCSNSANPVGRLMLQLFKIRDDAAYMYSDKICTALQITNFLQDISVDYRKGRIYLPQEELAYFGVEENSFENKLFNNNFREVMRFNVERTDKMFEQGKHLLPYLKGRFKLEIKWTIAGGKQILNKIKKNDYNVLRVRPYLSKNDFIWLFTRSLL